MATSPCEYAYDALRYTTNPREHTRELADYRVPRLTELSTKPSADTGEKPRDAARYASEPSTYRLPRGLNVIAGVSEEPCNHVPRVTDERGETRPHRGHGVAKVLPHLLTKIGLGEEPHQAGYESSYKADYKCIAELSSSCAT